MAIHPKAGLKADPRELTNVARLMSDYFTIRPDMSDPACHVSFGTSGHRGVSSKASFNEAHILAISQAVAEYRKGQNIGGPLYLGMDSHALSEAAFVSALEVLCANDVDVVVQEGLSYTPTPVVSHAILCHNRGLDDADPKRADGIIITPSHNPPMYGGFKYNPPTGGPAGTDATRWIQNRANALMMAGLDGVKRVFLPGSRKHAKVHHKDYIAPYVNDLRQIIDMDAIAASGLRLGVNPLGGSTLDFWNAIGETYKLNLVNTQPYIDATFGFMTQDHDGKIRMDCSSPYAMASMIELKDSFDLAFGNDPDGDRHGIVTRGGLMNPNHYLAVMIEYLYTTRMAWPKDMKVGKTLVSSALIDRVCQGISREVYEVPVGFKWFVDGLFSRTLGFGGEESAGASFLRFDGGVWSTDKDGMIPCLLAAEMTAKTGLDPHARHAKHVELYGEPAYGRIETAAEARVRKMLGALTAENIKIDTLAGEKVERILTHAPGNGAAIGGLKICSEHGWFAVRPSGTEDIYKIYAESFLDKDHLAQIQTQAVEIVNEVTK
ncbi:MAG: alpha-D-glucose phosphate-specific phosphoglucomutase [Proteobacteria bacterium]|nr:alpha-D-glucose phosphate-specific phosphoglucomutase [Pseudomonadota bacterium]